MTTEQVGAAEVSDSKFAESMNLPSDTARSVAQEVLPKASDELKPAPKAGVPADPQKPMTWLQFFATIGLLFFIIAVISIIANGLYLGSWVSKVDSENQTTAQRLQELQAQTNRKLDVDQVTATQQLSMKGATDQINALNLEVQTLSKTVSAQSLRMTKLQHSNAQLVNGQVKLLKAFMEATEAANKNPGLAHRPIELHIEIPLGEIELPPQVTRPRI